MISSGSRLSSIDRASKRRRPLAAWRAAPRLLPHRSSVCALLANEPLVKWPTSAPPAAQVRDRQCRGDLPRRSSCFPAVRRVADRRSGRAILAMREMQDFSPPQWVICLNWPPRRAKCLPCPKQPRAPVAKAPIKAGDHLILVDGSGFIFRAFHALPPLTRKSDDLPVGAVAGFCNMIWKMLQEGPTPEKGADRADAFRRHLRLFGEDLPQRHLPRLQGAPAGAALRPDPAIRADPAGDARLQPRLPRAGGLGGRRPHRDLRERGDGGAAPPSPSSPPTRT